MSLLHPRYPPGLRLARVLTARLYRHPLPGALELGFLVGALAATRLNYATFPPLIALLHPASRGALDGYRPPLRPIPHTRQLLASECVIPPSTSTNPSNSSSSTSALPQLPAATASSSSSTTTTTATAVTATASPPPVPDAAASNAWFLPEAFIQCTWVTREWNIHGRSTPLPKPRAVYPFGTPRPSTSSGSHGGNSSSSPRSGSPVGTRRRRAGNSGLQRVAARRGGNRRPTTSHGSPGGRRRPSQRAPRMAASRSTGALRSAWPGSDSGGGSGSARGDAEATPGSTRHTRQRSRTNSGASSDGEKRRPDSADSNHSSNSRASVGSAASAASSTGSEAPAAPKDTLPRNQCTVPTMVQFLDRQWCAQPLVREASTAPRVSPYQTLRSHSGDNHRE